MRPSTASSICVRSTQRRCFRLQWSSSPSHSPESLVKRALAVANRDPPVRLVLLETTVATALQARMETAESPAGMPRRVRSSDPSHRSALATRLQAVRARRDPLVPPAMPAQTATPAGTAVPAGKAPAVLLAPMDAMEPLARPAPAVPQASKAIPESAPTALPATLAVQAALVRPVHPARADSPAARARLVSPAETDLPAAPETTVELASLATPGSPVPLDPAITALRPVWPLAISFHLSLLSIAMRETSIRLDRIHC